MSQCSKPKPDFFSEKPANITLTYFSPMFLFLCPPKMSETTKWSNTLKQFVSYCQRIVWVFDHFVVFWHFKGVQKWNNGLTIVKNHKINFQKFRASTFQFHCSENVWVWRFSVLYLPVFGPKTKIHGLPLHRNQLIQLHCKPINWFLKGGCPLIFWIRN